MSKLEPGWFQRQLDSAAFRAEQMPAWMTRDVSSPAEQWTPEQRGRALHFIIVLANTPPDGWRSKAEIYEALAEFRSPQEGETLP